MALDAEVRIVCPQWRVNGLAQPGDRVEPGADARTDLVERVGGWSPVSSTTTAPMCIGVSGASTARFTRSAADSRSPRADGIRTPPPNISTQAEPRPAVRAA